MGSARASSTNLYCLPLFAIRFSYLCLSVFIRGSHRLSARKNCSASERNREGENKRLADSTGSLKHCNATLLRCAAMPHWLHPASRSLLHVELSFQRLAALFSASTIILTPNRRLSSSFQKFFRDCNKTFTAGVAENAEEKTKPQINTGKLWFICVHPRLSVVSTQDTSAILKTTLSRTNITAAPMYPPNTISTIIMRKRP